MATEFESAVELTPDDFRTEEFPKVRPITSDDINRAAIAAMQEVDPVSSFVDIAQDRSISNDSPVQTELLAQSKEQVKEEMIAEVHQILGNPDLTLEQKKQQALNIQDDNNEVFEPRNIVATTMSSRPSFNEEVNKEEQIISWSKNINEWNRFIDFKQKALASFTSSTEGGKSALKDLVDISLFLVPFIDPALRADVAEELLAQGLIEEDQVSSWGSPKTNQKAINSVLSTGDIEQRKEVIGKVLSVIDNSTKAFGITDNDFAKIELARSFLEDEFFGDMQGNFGNGVLLLDFVTIVLPFLKASKVSSIFKGTVTGANDVRRAVLDKVRASYTKGETAPSSPAELARNTNVDQAKRLNEALDAGGEDFANAAYGTDKTGATIDDIMPDPTDASGTVKNKVTNVESVVDEVQEILAESGRIQISEAERILARQTVINKIEKGSTDEVSFRSSSSQFGELDESARFKYSAVYGATDTAGFTNVEEAIEQVLYANRSRGAVREDLTILSRSETGDYVPLIGSADETDDILVRLDLQHEIGPKDIKFISAEDAPLVKASILDKLIPQAQGKLSAFAKVMESTFSPIISKPILAEAERGTLIGQVLKSRIDEFTGQFKKLDVGQQSRVDQYLRQANLEGIPFSRKSLEGKGWSQKEINTVATFRQYYDDIWTLQNKLEVKELSSEGFGLIKTGDNSEFIAKPVSQIEAGIDGFFYNAKTGEVMPLTELSRLGDEFSDLKLHQLPAEASTREFSFSHILSDPKDWRSLRDFDTVKAYRAGYYTVDYVDPLFVIKQFTTPDGKIRTKAVSTAGDVQSAKREVSRLNSGNVETGVEYFHRVNVRDKRLAKRQVDTERGNYNMKFRGERLLGVNGASDEVLRAAIKDPLSSMIASADKLSKRLSMEDAWNTIRARFTSAYKDVLPQGQYPKLSDEIFSTKSTDASKVTQAKVMYNWMESQLRVDGNLTDAAFQSALTDFAAIYAGTKGFAKTEKLFRAVGKMEPIAAIKKAVYTVFVSLNPPRQLTLAVADSLKATAIAPGYVASGKIFKDSTAIGMMKMGTSVETAAKMSGRSSKETAQLLTEFERSGLSAGIQKQALVQKGVKTTAEEVTLKKAARGEGLISKGIRLADKAGFQTAERLQNVAAWLAFRASKVKQTGRFNLTKSELDEITAEARHFAYSQTKEAAPAYNSSSLATVMQFAGVIHKGISLTLPEVIGGSRILSGAQVTKLWGFLLTTYGVALTQGIDEELIKIENREVRETLRSGLLWNVIYQTTGADISTKNLNPADYAGFAERIKQVANGEWANASPALGLANKFKLNAEVVRSLWGDVGDDVLELDTAEKAMTQVRALAEFFPAASNFMKASVISKVNRSVSQHNYTKDSELSVSEVIFKKLGFQTKDEEDLFLLRNMRKATLEEKKGDVKGLMNGLRAVAAMKGLDSSELAQRIATSQVFWQAYADDPEVTRMVDKGLQFLLTKDDSTYQMLTKMLGMLDEDDMQGAINIAPLTEEERANMTNMNKEINKLKGEIDNGKL